MLRPLVPKINPIDTFVKSPKNRGFTIVELLIVIVVIGILAAIVIVAYNGVQSRSYTAAVQSDVNNVIKRNELALVQSSIASYPKNKTEIIASGVKFSESAYKAAVWCTNTTGTAWGLALDSKDGKSYYANNTTNKLTDYTGTVQGTSGATTCPNIGVSGGWVWLLQSPTGPWYP